MRAWYPNSRPLTKFSFAFRAAASRIGEGTWPQVPPLERRERHKDMRPVSARVGNVRNNDSSLIEPVAAA
jgi:hypothetical protein